MLVRTFPGAFDFSILTQEGFSFESLGQDWYSLEASGECDLSLVILWDGTFVNGNRNTFSDATLNINGNVLVTDSEGLLDFPVFRIRKMDCWTPLRLRDRSLSFPTSTSNSPKGLRTIS